MFGPKSARPRCTRLWRHDIVADVEVPPALPTIYLGGYLGAAELPKITSWRSSSSECGLFPTCQICPNLFLKYLSPACRLYPQSDIQ